MAEKLLKNKKILITGGPVWVPVDKVRIMTNIFRGSLGLNIALEAARMGGSVIFLLGPGRIDMPENLPGNLKIIRFKYFEELLGLMKKEIILKKPDIVIHSAAVPDYIPKRFYNGKIKSGRKELIIEFKPTIKIVDMIKKWNSSAVLVKFKLEVGLSRKKLIDIAYKSMVHSNADLIVANNFEETKGNHIAFIIDNDKNTIKCEGKSAIARKLLLKTKNLL